MAKEVDARGLECPKPVILAKKAIEEGEAELEVLVDNNIACDNVSRLGEKMGCIVEVTTLGEDFVIRLKKAGDKMNQAGKLQEHSSVIFINSDAIGQGGDELGRALLKTFLNTLAENSNKPDKVIFMNSGVKMVTEGSPVLDSLKKLADQDVEILACGTCLDYFNLKDKVVVGRISNMFDILDSFLAADKVITV